MKTIMVLLFIGILGCTSTIDSVTISSAHQKCTDISDCVSIITLCNGCDCGTPINREYVSIYSEEMEENCRNSKIQCDAMCEKQSIDCVEGKCVFV